MVENYKPTLIQGAVGLWHLRYQQEGINWLAFLKRFNHHGILCDDMGLGKTLQSSTIVASDVAKRIAVNANDLLPSLIVCPSTLVGHWVNEIEKFIESYLLASLQYIVRKDIDYLSQLFWNYCILDEVHIIKNSKSKVTGAVKQLKAQRRLIQNGTPIQNNVLDLWSLFDFLMPGFFGTERQVGAPTRVGLVASVDVIVPPGNIGLDPSQTSFFQLMVIF
ncbi:TATA-binding -associated factor BTAF1 isoform X1 [Olea europaea subsp. europaea]|uniref:TATA-binding -associated factor BTAF1 isoform X1 n=1 Tax=Olea europaea subsp. europaea TaxID=158383 RepID=A0A8S0S7E2_OLEEU|nr:TATA-binding -associated factor BTAF1 isoform X1 [Olea europaea subsp. europaea]